MGHVSRHQTGERNVCAQIAQKHTHLCVALMDFLTLASAILGHTRALVGGTLLFLNTNLVVSACSFVFRMCSYPQLSVK